MFIIHIFLVLLKAIALFLVYFRKRSSISWWAKNIADVVLDGQNESTHEVMTQIAQKADWLDYFRFEVNLNKPKRADEMDFDGTLKEARNLMIQALNNQHQAQFNQMISCIA